jgi:hypothetical protein
MTTAKQTRVFFQVIITVQGIKGRDRNIKSHNVKIKELPETATIEDLAASIPEVIAKVKSQMKSVTKWGHLRANHIEETREGGWISTKMEPFGEKNMAIKIEGV